MTGLILASLAFALRAPLLRAAGNWLIQDEPAVAADVAVVLAGDHWGNRLRRACELTVEGKAPRILVSGPATLYGTNEGEIAIQWAIGQGCPADRLENVRSRTSSTREEAVVFRKVLAEKNVRRYLLVTSNFHSRRAAGIFREEIPGIAMSVVATPHREFDPDGWWRKRQGRKVFFFEFLKTVTNWFGI